MEHLAKMEHLVVEDYIVENAEKIFLKNTTYIAFEKCNNEPMRWNSDNTLFFAGSKEDAMLNLPEEEFYAIPVKECSPEIQAEYEKRILECIESGEIFI